jgi:hypothetical protein
VQLKLMGGPTTGILVSQDITGGAAQPWITSPILEICIGSSVTINPATLQLVLSNLGSLTSPHTVINLPGLQANAWTPVYLWDDGFGLNFSSGKGVRSWGIQGTSVPDANIDISVFVHDVPFQRHYIHGNDVVRTADHAFYLQAALQDFEFFDNYCTDPGFGKSGSNLACVQLDPTSLNDGTFFYATMFSGQVHDNHLTNNGAAASRIGVNYNSTDANHPISAVRTFHNFFNGVFGTNVNYTSGGTITDAYYMVSGTKALGTGGTVTFPANGFSAIPVCFATDSQGVSAVQATPTMTGITLTGTGTHSIFWQCRGWNTLVPSSSATNVSTDGG